MACDSECLEIVPSMLTGDLCSDTNPTPTNYHCQDEVTHHKTCNGHNETVEYSNTPFTNFMGYTTGIFLIQYLDLIYNYVFYISK